MILIYAHCRLNCYDINRSISDPMYFDTPEIPFHVTQTLETFKDYDIRFYSSNPHTPLHEIQANKKTLVKDSSFDFGIYKRAILEMYDSGKTDNLIIMNDGCFVIPENLYRLQNEWIKYDFLGITYNPAPTGHLQSYFILFTKKVVDSPEFRKFWMDLPYGMDKVSTIHKGELNLTATLIRAGFQFGYFCKFNMYNGWSNPQCLRMKTPILKIKQNEGIYNQYKEKYSELVKV